VGAGSARDALSALDQVAAAGGVDERAGDTDALLEGLLERDPGAALAAVHGAVAAGRDPRVVTETLIGRLRDAFLASVGVGLDHLPEGDRERTEHLAERAERPFLTRSLEVLGEALVAMRQAADPRITLETALVRLADVGADTSVAALVERLDRLERAIASSPAPAAPAAPSSAPGRRAASGPAVEARRRLAERASAPAVPDPAPAPTPEPAPQRAADPSPPGTDPAAGSLPTREELTLAWGDTVLGSLVGPARARFAAGRFVDVAAGAAVYALPNDAHRNRCEEVRAAVETALAAHFGRPVPLRLVVDGDATGPPAASPEPVVAPEHEEPIDVHELADAPAEPPRSPAERLTDAFPGAQVLEEEKR
jgi:hypothetical protein